MSVGIAILVFIAIAALALAAFVATRPDSFRLERGVTIAAPPETVFPLIADFHRWTLWSPFEAMDAGLKRSFSGAESGVGAHYGWEGEKSGVGHMEILEATPSSRVVIKLDFFKPVEAHNTAEFTIAPTASGGSAVTWAMYGPHNLVSKLFSLVFNMEKITGPMFEQGLATMKTVAETGKT